MTKPHLRSFEVIWGHLRTFEVISRSFEVIWGETYLDQIVHKGLSFQSFHLNSSKINYHGSFPYLHHQNSYTKCMIVWNVTKRTYRIVDRSLNKINQSKLVVCQPIRARKILPGLSHGHRQQKVAWSLDPASVKSFQFDLLLISVNWISKNFHYWRDLA